jgi:hypothetical protein
MKVSGHLVIGRFGDREPELTAETRRRGEDPLKPTTEARRHGEGSGDRRIGKSEDRKGREDTGLYQGTSSSRAVNGKNVWALAPVLSWRVMQILHATLREIFDESAYERFLQRTQASRSTASYRAFTRERDAAMVKKPRCC